MAMHPSRSLPLSHFQMYGSMYSLVMLRERLRSVALLVGVGLWLASLALYLSTLAPTLTWGWRKLGVDGGELLAAANTLGVPHPPGYPTYTLLLKTFATIVPFGDFAFRGNLLSAVMASLTVVTVYLSILRFCRHLKPESPAGLGVASGALGASAFAASPLFWSQATITEVYTLNSLFAGILLLIATHLALPLPASQDGERSPATVRLALFGFVLGIGLGNHLTLLAVAAPMLVWLWLRLGRRSFLSPWLIGAFALGILIYVYLPIRASQDPPVNWGNADTRRGAVWMLTGGPYGGYLFDVPVERILECSSSGCRGRLISWLKLLFSQFNPLGLFFGLLGAWTLRRNNLSFLLLTIVSFVVLSVYAITYNTADFEVFIIPAFLLFSTWIGIGFFRVLSTLAERPTAGRPVLFARLIRPSALHVVLVTSVLALLLLPGVSVVLNYESQDLSGDRSAFNHASDLLGSVPDGSVLLSERDRTVFSLWYMRYVEQPHRDVATIAVPLLQFDWYRRDIHRAYPDRIPEITSEDALGAVRKIIEHDGSGTGVFTTFTSSFLSSSFDVGQVGSVFRVTPKGSAAE